MGGEDDTKVYGYRLPEVDKMGDLSNKKLRNLWKYLGQWTKIDQVIRST